MSQVDALEGMIMPHILPVRRNDINKIILSGIHGYNRRQRICPIWQWTTTSSFSRILVLPWWMPRRNLRLKFTVFFRRLRHVFRIYGARRRLACKTLEVICRYSSDQNSYKLPLFMNDENLFLVRTLSIWFTVINH